LLTAVFADFTDCRLLSGARATLTRFTLRIDTDTHAQH
jgi:hypothetical protein